MATTGDKSAAASDTPPASAPTKFGWIHRPQSILLQAGSAAAAISSIIGLLVFVVPSVHSSGGADKVTAVLKDGEEMKLGVEPDVERMTFGRWLEQETGSREGARRAEQSRPGVDVHYTAEFPAFAKGSPFRARFTLKDQTNATKHVHIATARLDADRDRCSCAEFVPVPTGPSSYRVLVELFRPGAPYAAPVLKKYTDWFTAGAPGSSG